MSRSSSLLSASLIALSLVAAPVLHDARASESQVAATAAPVEVDEVAFKAWLNDLTVEARGKGYSAATLTAALGPVKPVPKVIEYDRFQPEFSQTFWSYMKRATNQDRIAKGKQLLARHKALLDRVATQYGVQARFLVAFWGMETNYGANFGGFRVIDALATLSFEGRRGPFFRNELYKALDIVERGHIAPDRMIGSWAGAMGHLQFMPSTYAAHAVDDDGNGAADIWGSLPDTFASAANYLSAEGWKDDQTWGREVRLPKGFDPALSGMDSRRALSEWASLGIRRADGGVLPVVEGMTASLVLPAGIGGPGFLVYDNFRTIMIWNRSVLYALAVGHLADRLVGQPDLVATPAPGDRPMSRAEVMELQSLLARLGYEVGEPDGVAGSRTQSALKAFQSAEKRPADGYPDPAALDALRTAVARGGVR